MYGFQMQKSRSGFCILNDWILTLEVIRTRAFKNLTKLILYVALISMARRQRTQGKYTVGQIFVKRKIEHSDQFGKLFYRFLQDNP